MGGPEFNSSERRWKLSWEQNFKWNFFQAILFIMNFCMSLNTLLTLSINYKLYTKAPRVSWVTLSTFMKTLETISLRCRIIVHETILIDSCHLSLTDPSKQAALEKVFLNLLAGFHPRRVAPSYRCHASHLWVSHHLLCSICKHQPNVTTSLCPLPPPPPPSSSSSLSSSPSSSSCNFAYAQQLNPGPHICFGFTTKPQPLLALT